jgi:hypothetical protein
LICVKSKRCSLDALERALSYLKIDAGFGIHYTKYLRIFDGYSNSNWIYDTDEIKTMSG